MDMRIQKHIMFAVSGHGFGHIGQCAPIVQCLLAQYPNIKISIRGDANPVKLKERMGDRVNIQTAKLDIGMLQKTALDVDEEGTLRAYRELHLDWEERVQHEADILSKQDIDLIVANIPYLTLAAARLAGIPCVAYCSLNWFDIYNHFFPGEGSEISAQIRSSYLSCGTYICPEPSMPMTICEQRLDVPPVYHLPVTSESPLQIASDRRIVLVTWGGMELDIDFSTWETHGKWVFILPDEMDTSNMENFYTLRELGVSYSQALRQCCALIAKPGYGTFVEAAAFGKPILFLPRTNWPEMDSIISWFNRFSVCMPITLQQLSSGEFIAELDQLTNANINILEQNGSQEVADLIVKLLCKS